MAVKYLEGNVVSKGIKVAIVGARFNEFITSKLISGAIDALVRHNVNEDDIKATFADGILRLTIPEPREQIKKTIAIE